jgi:hypothetical protein
MSPAMLRRVLAFMYRGAVPEGFENRVESASAGRSLGERLPLVDAILATRAKRSVTNHQGNTPGTTTPSTTPANWATILEDQATLDKSYNLLLCVDEMDIAAETDVFAAAESLGLDSLKRVVLRKISTWIEKVVKADLPLSGNSCNVMHELLRSDTVIIDTVLHVLTQYPGAVNTDKSLCGMIEELFPHYSAGLKEAEHATPTNKDGGRLQGHRAQLAKFDEPKQNHLVAKTAQRSLVDELQKSNVHLKAKASRAEDDIARADKRMVEMADKVKQAEERARKAKATMREADAHAITAEARAAQCQDLYRLLQDELLEQKPAAKKFNEGRLPATPSTLWDESPPLQQLQAEMQALKARLESQSPALSKDNNASSNNKGDTSQHTDDVYKQNIRLRDAINKLCNFTAKTGSCAGCHRESTTTISHNNYTKICMMCDECDRQRWISGSVSDD